MAWFITRVDHDSIHDLVDPNQPLLLSKVRDDYPVFKIRDKYLFKIVLQTVV
jgi:hypothetical protein